MNAKTSAAVVLVFALSCGARAAVPLKLWHAYRGGEEKALEQSVKLFELDSGLKVELLALPYDAFAAKLIAAIPHGAGPDVFIFAHERVGLFARMGIAGAIDGAVDRAAYFSNTIDALQIDGKLYGYPLSLKCLALFVNTRLAPKPPATTDELRVQLLRLRSAAENRFGLAYESGDFYLHEPFLSGFGGKLFDGSGRAIFDTPEMARSLAYVKGLQDEHLIPEEASGALVKSLFNDQRAAMVISGPWFAGEISKTVPYAVFPLPRVSETGLPMRPFLGVEAALVSAKSQNPEAARKLARFLSLGEASVARAVVGGQVPANFSAYENQTVREDRLVSSFKEASKNAVPMPNTLEMARVWEPMKLALRAVLMGGATPAQAGALADRRYRALYRPKPPEAAPRTYLLIFFVAAAAVALSLRSKYKSPIPFSKRYPDARRAFGYAAPAAAGMLLLVFVPFVFGVVLSLFHHDSGRYTFVGFANFVDILASRGYRVTEPLSFYFTLAVTILWTLTNVTFHVTIGLAFALILKDPLLKLRGVYRVLLIVPWAVPNYITALIWKGMFHRQFGAVNGLLAALHIQPVSWFTSFSTAFAANVVTNTWLGFPFMMVVCLGALQSIPPELYEAADVDGASSWQKFRNITLPLLRPALLPAVILGSVWTFNMFNIIYLVSGGEPGGATDILVSESYRWAFQRNEQYGFAAAYSVLIFIVLLGWSALTKRLVRDSEDVLS